MSLIESENSAIDVVIPWVDGADPAHKAKLDAYLASIGGERPRAASPSRFHNSNEIEYCVVSLFKFAPWVRTIYLVTDNQTPAFLQKLKGTEFEHRVKIIDHTVVFAGYEHCLPTFNSSTILTVLWRIPHLSEHFLFLNDDFALIRPVEPQDFFRGNAVVLRGNWRKFTGDIFAKRIGNFIRRCFGAAKKPAQIRAGYLAAQELSAKLLGFSRYYFQVPHNPHAWKLSMFRDFFAERDDLLTFNISFRLRSSEQFIGEALAAHLAILRKEFVVDESLKTLQLKPADQALVRIKHKLKRADEDNNTAFVCVQNIEQAPEENREAVLAWLDKRIGLVEEFLAQQALMGV